MYRKIRQCGAPGPDGVRCAETANHEGLHHYFSEEPLQDIGWTDEGLQRFQGEAEQKN